MEHFEKNPGTFEKNPGPKKTKKNLVEPFVKNPTDLDTLFARQNKQKKNVSILNKVFTFAHTSVTGQQIIDIKIKCKRHLVKWQVASGSFMGVYLSHFFSNISIFLFRKHFDSDFWGMLKTLLI